MYRNSVQRNRLLAYLEKTTEHPTAARLYECLRQDVRRLSLGTVYRNLDILRSQGKIRVLSGDGRQARYDACLEPHGHFYCRLCGQVLDLQLPVKLSEWNRSLTRSGHRVETCEVELSGVCAACAGQSKLLKEEVNHG